MLNKRNDRIEHLFERVYDYYLHSHLEAQDREDCTIKFIEDQLMNHIDKLTLYFNGILPDAWLWRCAENYRKNFYRHKYSHQSGLYSDNQVGVDHCSNIIQERDGNAPASMALIHELKKRLEIALSSLSSDTREVVLLHVIEGETYKELIGESHVTEDGIRKRIKRTLRRLRFYLEEAGWTEEDTISYLALLSSISTPPPVKTPDFGDIRSLINLQIPNTKQKV